MKSRSLFTRMTSPRSGRGLPTLGFLFLLVLIVAGSGCSSFHRDWKAAMAQPATVKGFDGPWEGTWESEETGHKGPLRCLITATTNQSRIYKAKFQAKYRKLISLTYSYTVTFEVEKKGDMYKFKGEADLGKLAGGVYKYDGQATITNFLSKYTCDMDHGTFRMGRPLN